MIPNTKVINSFWIRNIAIITMLIDHLGVIFWPDILILRYIGRLAFPLFAFLLVEGYHKTTNLKKYMARLLLAAIVSDIPFQLAINGNLEYQPFTNVLWTFLIGISVIHAITKLKSRTSHSDWIGYVFVITVIGFIFAEWVGSDYSGIGIIMIAGLHLFRGDSTLSKIGQFTAFVLANIIITNIGWEMYHGLDALSPQYYAILSLLIIWSYNGKQGIHAKAYRLFSYLFYPVHLTVLAILGRL